jgi:DNA-binding NarL/FixJ family response regulator
MTEQTKNEQVDLAIILGYIATKDLATTEKKVAVLSNLGFSNKDMAKICNTNDKVIKTLKSKIKKGA